MANWLDILSQNYTDQRGRLNPFALARGFSSRGRGEIDQTMQISDAERAQRLGELQRHQAAINAMGQGFAPNAQPRSPEEAALMQGIANLYQTQAATAGQQAQTATENMLRNPRAENVAAATANTQANTARTTAMTPGEVEGQNIVNAAGRFQTERAQGLYPGELQAQQTGNQQAGFNLQRSQAMLPYELGQQEIGLRQGAENLYQSKEIFPFNLANLIMGMEHLGAQTAAQQQATQQSGELHPYNVTAAQLRNRGALQQTKEAEAGAPFRQKILESTSTLSPGVKTLIDSGMFFADPAQLNRAAQMLNVPLPPTPVDPQAQALTDSVNAIVARRGQQGAGPTQPSPEVPVGSQATSVAPARSAPASTSPRKRGTLPPTEDLLKKYGDKFFETFGNKATAAEYQQFQQMVSTPQGVARLQEALPSMSPSDQTRVKSMITQLGVDNPPALAQLKAMIANMQKR